MPSNHFLQFAPKPVERLAPTMADGLQVLSFCLAEPFAAQGLSPRSSEVFSIQPSTDLVL